MLSSGSGSQACSPLSSAVLLCCSGTCRRLPQHGCDHDEAGILCLHNSIKLLQHNRVSGLQASKALLWLLTLCVLARPQAAPAAQPGSDRSADQYMGQPERPLRAHSDPRLLPGSKHFVQVQTCHELAVACSNMACQPLMTRATTSADQRAWPGHLWHCGQGP